MTQQTADKKVMGNSPSVSGRPAATEVDVNCRQDLLDAIATFKALPFDGGEAVERFNLYEEGEDLEYLREWASQALDEVDWARQQAAQPYVPDDDDIPFDD